MTQLISFLHFLHSAVRMGRLGVLPIKIYRGNNAVFVSVDLIGEKNQVILEYAVFLVYLSALAVTLNIFSHHGQNCPENTWERTCQISLQGDGAKHHL